MNSAPHETCTGPSLERACTALWAATLSLMTAYMHNTAPAHRLLLARRIASNFQTLAQQECFSKTSRDAFARLQQRWHGTAMRLAGAFAPSSSRGLLHRLLPFR